MKNFIFVDFDKLVTNNYKNEFTGFNDVKLEALAKVIENEVIAMGKQSEVEVVLITAIPEREVIGKFIEEGYAFANSVEFLGKEKGESAASAIFDFVLSNVRDVNNYVVLGTSASKYVRIPNDKVIFIDEAQAINAENIIKKLISVRHVREMAVEKIMEKVKQIKEEVAKEKPANKQPENDKQPEDKQPEASGNKQASGEAKANNDKQTANDAKTNNSKQAAGQTKANETKANSAKK